MTQVIKIGCPRCGAVLSVQQIAGIESKHVTCPICKNKGVFTTFNRIVEKQDDGATQVSDTLMKKSDDMTSIGQLKINGLTFKLHIGKNIIGRQASGNNADIQLPPTVATKRMSRQHIVIDVKKLPNGTFRHELSLFKPEVNSTFLNSDKLNYGDTLVLMPDNIIRLPDCELLFSADDTDKTNYDGSGYDTDTKYSN